MKKPFSIVVLGLLLSGCSGSPSILTGASWEQMRHITLNRDARINLFNTNKDSLKTIYVGVLSDSDEKWQNMYYTKSVVQPKAQHFAPKEVIAKQQCIKNFSLEKPILKEIIEFSKEKRKQYELGYPKYAKYSCEKSNRQIQEANQEANSAQEKIINSLASNNTDKRSFKCVDSISKKITKIKILGETATEITYLGNSIKYFVVTKKDGKYTLRQPDVAQTRSWLIGSMSFLLIDTDVFPHQCS